MTTGTLGTIPSGKTSSYYKSWSGQNGKYLSDGRDKWNTYSMFALMVGDQYGPPGNSTASVTSGSSGEWTNSDNFRLQSKLVEQVKGHKFNLAVDLAQAHQLVNMCSSSLLHLGRSLRYLKRGDISSALRELGVKGKNSKLKSKDVSGRWLEIQYGWMPFLSSCYESAKAFEELSKGRSTRVVATVAKWQVVNRSASPSNYTSLGVSKMSKRIVCELTEELSLARSLGLTDPLSVLWEITPYSFVADWFIPIGSYLDNLNVIPELNGRFLTTFYKRCPAEITWTKPGSNWDGARRKGYRIEVERTVSTSLTTQRPQFVDLGSAVRGKRIANAISLFHQLIA